MTNLLAEAALRLHELLDYVDAGGKPIDFTSRSDVMEILDTTDCMVDGDSGIYQLVDMIIAMHAAGLATPIP